MDVRSSAQEAGKRTGKDEEAGKTTWPGLLGIEGAQAALDATIADALKTLAPYEQAAENLAFLACSLSDRTR